MYPEWVDGLCASPFCKQIMSLNLELEYEGVPIAHIVRLADALADLTELRITVDGYAPEQIYSKDFQKSVKVAKQALPIVLRFPRKLRMLRLTVVLHPDTMRLFDIMSRYAGHLKLLASAIGELDALETLSMDAVRLSHSDSEDDEDQNMDDEDSGYMKVLLPLFAPLARLAHLTELRVPFLSNTHIPFVRAIPNLRNLVFSCESSTSITKAMSDSAFCAMTAEPPPKLAICQLIPRITAGIVPSLLRLAPTLEKLRTRCDVNDARPILSHFTRLTDLRLPPRSTTDIVLFMQASQPMTQLRSLELHCNSPLVTQAALTDMLRPLVHLTTLNLFNSMYRDGTRVDSLAFLEACAPLLRDLTLIGFWASPTAEVHHLRRFHQLENLTLYKCFVEDLPSSLVDEMTPESATFLKEVWPHLRKVCLSH